MKRTELKTAIRSVDIVKVWSRTFGLYVQVNKSKLLELLDTIPKDSQWQNTYFKKTEPDEEGKGTLYVH